MVIYALCLSLKQKSAIKPPKQLFKKTNIKVWGKCVVGSHVMEKLVHIILCKYASSSSVDAIQTRMPLCSTI